MDYVSTRNNEVKVTSAQAIARGISEEGGLFLPCTIPTLTSDDFENISKLDYKGRAAYILKMFLTDFTDEEIEYFMSLKPLSEILGTYGLSDFERALEGLQNFDEEHEIGLFEDEEWLGHLEEIRAQYDADGGDEEEEEAPKAKKTTVKKSSPAKKVEEPEEEEEDDEEEEEEDEKEEGDEFDDMERSELKKYIKDNDLDITVKKSMTDDDLRAAIRAASATAEEPEEEEEEETAEEPEEEEEAAPKLTLADIRKKLGKK